MTYELPMLFSGRGFAFIRDAAILSNISGTILFTMQAMGNPLTGIGI